MRVRTDSRALLREAGLSPKKGFGQNFLVSPHTTAAIAEACVTASEVGSAVVVELGAGLGALTGELALRSRKLFAVERDRDLVPILEREFEEERRLGQVVILEADAQTIDCEELFRGAEGLRVLCGNLPYQITGRLLQRAIEVADSIDRAVFMIQAEVADRLLAKPGTKAFGALTIFVQAAFDVARVRNVSPGSFHPAPDVSSTVVSLTPVRPRRAFETDRFRELVKRAFEARRKTLRNAWGGIAAPEAIKAAALMAEVSLDARGETLDVLAYARMAKALEAILTK